MKDPCTLRPRHNIIMPFLLGKPSSTKPCILCSASWHQSTSTPTSCFGYISKVNFGTSSCRDILDNSPPSSWTCLINSSTSFETCPFVHVLERVDWKIRWWLWAVDNFRGLRWTSLNINPTPPCQRHSWDSWCRPKRRKLFFQLYIYAAPRHTLTFSDISYLPRSMEQPSRNGTQG